MLKEDSIPLYKTVLEALNYLHLNSIECLFVFKHFPNPESATIGIPKYQNGKFFVNDTPLPTDFRQIWAKRCPLGHEKLGEFQKLVYSDTVPIKEAYLLDSAGLSIVSLNYLFPLSTLLTSTMTATYLPWSNLAMLVKNIKQHGIGLSEIYIKLMEAETGAATGIKNMIAKIPPELNVNPRTIVDSSPLIDQYTQWYFVTLSNFLRLLGIANAISNGSLNDASLKNPSASEKDNMKTFGLTFARSITDFPAIKKWRDKLAAHSVIFDPGHNDGTDMFTFALSDMKTIFRDGRYVSGVQLDATAAAHPLATISITELHEN